MFSRLELPRAWQDRVAELVSQDRSHVDVGAERRRLEARIARAREGVLDGVLDSATAKKAILDAEAEIGRLVASPHAAISAAHVLTDLKDLWPHMTDKERHKVV
jgi:hypothetical protein